MLVLAAIVLPVNLFHVSKVATISPIDEMMHIDYFIRASGPAWQRTSDVFSQEALDEIACRGHPTDTLPACGERPYPPDQFYWEGRNVASTHSPWYYLVTGVMSRPLAAALPGDSLVTWGRALGSAWLLVGLGLLFASGRRLGLQPWAIVPGLALIALSPAVQHAATTINPDATAILAGGLLTLVVVRTHQGSMPMWAPIPATFVCVSLDPGNILAVIAASLWLLASAPSSSLRRVSWCLVGMALGVVLAMAAQRGLLIALDARDFAGSPQDRVFTVDGLPGPLVWGEATLLAMMPPTRGYVFPALSTPAHTVAMAVALLVTIAGVVAAPFRDVLPERRRASAAGLATLLLAGPLLVALNYIQLSWYFPIPARYGLSVMPFVSVAIGAVFGDTWGGRVLLWAVSVVSALTTVAALW
jgi:hypothetical protein